VVTAGAKIIKYLTLTRSARMPTRGLNSEGILCTTARNPASVNDKLSLAIKRGRSGARKEV
jgi:hypothetical protein